MYQDHTVITFSDAGFLRTSLTGTGMSVVSPLCGFVVIVIGFAPVTDISLIYLLSLPDKCSPSNTEKINVLSLLHYS